MRDFKRSVCILLCAIMLAGMLSGCISQNVSAGTESAYEAAKARLLANKDITMEITVTEERGVGSDFLSEEHEKTVRYQGRGSDRPMIQVEGLIVYQSLRAAYEQLWDNGTTYAKVKEARYISNEDRDRFLSRQLPITILTPSCYSSVKDSGDQITFSDAVRAEAWAMPNDGELLEASGMAELQNGALLSETYEIRFLYGGASIHSVYHVRYLPYIDQDLSELIPGDTQDYVSLENAEAAVLLLRSKLALDNATVITAKSNYQVSIPALGVLVYQTEEINEYGEGKDYLEKLEIDSMSVDLSTGNTTGYHYEDRFADGTITIVYDDEEPITKQTSAALRQESLQGWLTDIMPSYGDIRNADIREVDAYYLVSFELNDEFAQELRGKANYLMFSDYDKLDGYSTAYVGKKAEGCLSVEKYSFLPTAIYLSYEGVYTLQGQQASLAMELSRAISLYDTDTYENLTGEPLPDERPQNLPTPLFYEVTGEEGQHMYLLGTVHVGDDRTAFLPQEIYDAFEASDALAVEFDDAAFWEEVSNDEALREKVAEKFYYRGGTTIDRHVDTELYRAAVSLMMTTGQYSEQANSMKPFVWSSTIENFYLSQGRRLSSAKGVDHRLLALARAQNKEIRNVESGEFQLDLISGYSDALQEVLLAQSVSTPRNVYLQNVDELYELWCSGDEQKIKEQLASKSDEELAKLSQEERTIYEEYHRQMELERNEAMTEVAIEYMTSGDTVFFAVGLAHLLGDGGLVDALRDAGFTVTRVQYN